MSDGKFTVLRQHHRCVYQSRQLGRSVVTPARPLALARRTASVIKSGFIRSAVHHFTSATLRRFHRRRLLHATDFFQAAGFTVRGGVSVMATFSFLATCVRSTWL
jgi:hypothetical protein